MSRYYSVQYLASRYTDAYYAQYKKDVVEKVFSRYDNLSWAVARDIVNIFEAVRVAYANLDDANIEAIRVATQKKIENTSAFHTALKTNNFDSPDLSVYIAYDYLLGMIDDIQFNTQDVDMKQRWIEVRYMFPEVAIQRWVKFGMDRESAKIAIGLED